MCTLRTIVRAQISWGPRADELKGYVAPRRTTEPLTQRIISYHPVPPIAPLYLLIAFHRFYFFIKYINPLITWHFQESCPVCITSKHIKHFTQCKLKRSSEPFPFGSRARAGMV
ncbi:uncharacterized protein BDZ99DRAFT_106070 [Mytilinidion resinicola]|uniref:Uncharacterized protein n=1 Tax=Mytilinidion resinicola TaxID=574789 RepID=A0A6A6YAC7_9PEZI|nr:uncharacterized protein BDZ99DRAFT_106070 [Mytilinidion resinicola]KAF2805483.1 hypothetical protein BDZ99DRAFT_106070 [Mytilinidion resinicola]